MTGLTLRPNLKTAGGEVSDIVLNNQFVGTLTLVYRESDRLCGAIQLEQESLSASDKTYIVNFLQTHVQHLIESLGVMDCEVVVTCSSYDHIVTIDNQAEEIASFEWVQDETFFEDINPDDSDYMDIAETELTEADYELVMITEQNNAVEYYIYDHNSELIAEVTLYIHGPDISGNINWKTYPVEEEMERAAEVIVSEFDEDEIDSYYLNMIFNAEIIDTYDLLHNELTTDLEFIGSMEDLEDTDNEIDDILEHRSAPDRNEYTFVLARDDEDTITYEIYQQSYGGLPIGTATIDMSRRQLTGYVDLREPGNADDRELITMLLLEELEKEKEFESVNISVLFRNKLIDELLFETDQLH
ncbi:hypothetical protein [Paenibacillus eucommiae]|uniref:Uncharacterized protein n=1 Tax=Paenibacillus eucommiae TaxID=1355755 RepID=A0ABS4INY8_9BACL|nr:hypothetical protein [Paenibacillus eucommiae]MBP1989225.1 hypothetical protein [Paenibacillus eucommiae]